jgi:glycerol uptake facilitator-like aquaporin
MQYGSEFGVTGIAFMLFAMLLIGGPITGAHFNPAVTLGVYMSN